jgi:hypothetical protein
VVVAGWQGYFFLFYFAIFEFFLIFSFSRFLWAAVLPTPANSVSSFVGVLPAAHRGVYPRW